MKNQKIVISIISHNQQTLVNRLLKSFVENVTYGENLLSIHIVENTECDCVLEVPAHLNIIYQNNLNPKGFGANHNAVFEKVVCDYFMVCNPDLIFDEKFDLEKFILQMGQRKYSIASPEVLNSDRSTADYFRSRLSLGNLTMRKLFGHEVYEKDWLAGMCLMIKADAFRHLKGFDENFIMYVEDCDLSVRAKALGYNIGDLIDFRVVHEARRASRRNWKLFSLHIRSLLYFWLKSLMIRFLR